MKRGVLAVVALGSVGAIMALRAAKRDVASERASAARSVTIRREPGDLYAMWQDPSGLPRFLSGLSSAERLDSGRQRWSVGPDGRAVRVEVTTVADDPGKRFEWSVAAGSAYSAQLSVTFEPLVARRATEVRMSIGATGPAVRAVAAVARLYGGSPAQVARESLRAFKALAEAGEIPQAVRN